MSRREDLSLHKAFGVLLPDELAVRTLPERARFVAGLLANMSLGIETKERADAAPEVADTNNGLRALLTQTVRVLNACAEKLEAGS